MAKKKKKSKKAENNVDLKPLLLVIFGIISGFIIYSEQTGGLGKVIKNILIGGVIGKLAYALPIALVVMGIYIVFRDFAKFKLKAFQFILLFVAIASLITCFDYNAIMQRHSADNWFQEIGIICSEGTSFAEADHEQSGGGLIGAIVTVPLIKAFDTNITTVILICILVVLGFLITGIAFSSIVIGIKEFLSKSYNKGKDNVQEMVAAKRARREEKEEAENLEMAIKSKNSSKKKDNKRFKQIMEQTEIVGNGKQIAITDLDLEDFEEDIEEEEPEEIDEVEEEEVDEIPDEIVEQKPKKKVLKPLHPENNRASAKVESNAEEIDIDTSSTEDYEEYIFPPISLLSEGGNDNEDYSTREMKEVASKLQNTLKSFNVDAKVVNVTRGPAVTQYEIQPNIGVKVSKIINLENDIALNLAAKSIRIEAPIPGKSAVGIEVPNKAKENVMLRDVIESDEFQDAPSKVTFALGKSIDGEPCVSDIAKMPHMLIAGATGSGKSVCINSILVSLLYKAKPNEVKLILIDPKVVELKVYNDIPHLLIPVVTDPKKAAGALNWAVQEMVNRYNLFAEKGVRDIRGYNDLLVQEGEDGLLPQIVIIIDELADLMMVAPSEVEDSIVRLTQMARAAGMHLIIATQRPSVDVVTGIIKANVPSRIAFTVSSQVDSRTILDMAGAEKLLGKGDMLYFPMGESKPIRIQGTYVSDKEVENIVEFVKKQNPGITYNPDIIESFEKANTPPQANSKGGDSPEPDCDELLTDAIELAVQMGNASASMIQRKFKVGYARAGRIIDQMEERGIVSGYDGSKPRQTLISKEEWEEMKEAGVDSVKYEEVDEDEYEEYEEDSESEDEEVYEDENEEYEEDDEEVEDSDEESDEEYEEEEEEDTEEEEE